MKETSLSREVIERAARRVKEIGLFQVKPADERGFDSWRVNETVFTRHTRTGIRTRVSARLTEMPEFDTERHA
jgi:hypothetical protein